MTAWDKAIAHVLKWEGGYVDDPHDLGGATNMGISQRAHPGLDIKNLTVETATQIYREQYWRQIKGDDLPEPLAIVLFDSAVNCGISRSVKWLQELVQVMQDGRLGKVTLAAIYRDADRDLAGAHCWRRERHYRMLSTFLRYGKGWLNRLDDCRRVAGLLKDE